MNRLRWPSLLIVVATIAGTARAAPDAPNSWPLASNEEAWKFLPETLTGSGSRLPTWARATARISAHHGRDAEPRPPASHEESARSFAPGQDAVGRG